MNSDIRSQEQEEQEKTDDETSDVSAEDTENGSEEAEETGAEDADADEETGTQQTFDDEKKASVLPPEVASVTLTAKPVQKEETTQPSRKQPEAPTAVPRQNTKQSANKNKDKSGVGLLIVLCLIVMLAGGVVSYLYSTGALSFGQSQKDDGVLPTPVVSDADATEQASATSEAETQATTETTVTTTTTTTAAPLYPTLKKGDRNKDVKKMQERLCKLGYMSEESCTGYYGSLTESCVKLFQKKAGLPKTGKADSDTLTRLYAADAPKCVD